MSDRNFVLTRQLALQIVIKFWKDILSLITVEVFQSLMDVFRVSRCSTCPRTIFVCWSSLGSVTGTAIMCPRGRLGVKPGAAYGAFDRWRQSVLEASPPGGVL